MNLLKIILFTLTLVVMEIATVVHGQETNFREQSHISNFVSVDENLQGMVKEYYDTGELKAEIIYKNGNIESKREFLKNGKLERETRYLEDKKYETHIEYYNTGELFRERSLINGKLEGLEKEYYQNGKLKAQRNYKEGKRHGNASGYYINGNLQGDWEFSEGVPVKATIFFSSGEKWLEHTDFDKAGRLNGVSKEYNKEGDFVARRHYKDDVMVKRESVKKWF
jgi:antitoxin component YwqK of YwqJK toxin-antitoxin module